VFAERLRLPDDAQAFADTLTMERATGGYARGAVFGLAAVSIWAGAADAAMMLRAMAKDLGISTPARDQASKP